jgi:hypothetical protein
MHQQLRQVALLATLVETSGFPIVTAIRGVKITVIMVRTAQAGQQGGAAG